VIEVSVETDGSGPQMARKAAIYSSMRFPRSLIETLEVANSWSIQPWPRPGDHPPIAEAVECGEAPGKQDR